MCLHENEEIVCMMCEFFYAIRFCRDEFSKVMNHIVYDMLLSKVMKYCEVRFCFDYAYSLVVLNVLILMMLCDN